MIPDIVNNGISSLMSILPLPNMATLIPVKREGPIPIPTGLPFTAMFNPETFEISKKVSYNNDQPCGAQGTVLRYCATPEPNFNLEFLIDGTGASGKKVEVELEIQKFLQTVGFSGDEHSPNQLILVWGTFYAYCKMRSTDIRYTLFRQNGTPLRATIKVTFEGYTERLLDLLISNLMSPDLTHFRTVNEGDTLPKLCQKVYDTPRYYLEVARANGLTSPRMLRRNAELRFPPVEKKAGNQTTT